MRSIGIRELRDQARKYLQDVERGETIQVTNRGRPVALLVPVARRSAAERLVADGLMTPAKGDLLDLGPPLKPLPGQRLPSEVLADMRADER